MRERKPKEPAKNQHREIQIEGKRWECTGQNRGRALPICQCLTCLKDRLLIFIANHWWAKEAELLFCNKLGKPKVRNKVALKLQETLKGLGIAGCRASRLSIPAPRLETSQALGIHFVSLSELLDTSTPAGKMVFTLLGAVIGAQPHRGTGKGRSAECARQKQEAWTASHQCKRSQDCHSARSRGVLGNGLLRDRTQQGNSPANFLPGE